MKKETIIGIIIVVISVIAAYFMFFKKDASAADPDINIGEGEGMDGADNEVLNASAGSTTGTTAKNTPIPNVELITWDDNGKVETLSKEQSDYVVKIMSIERVRCANHIPRYKQHWELMNQWYNDPIKRKWFRHGLYRIRYFGDSVMRVRRNFVTSLGVVADKSWCYNPDKEAKFNEKKGANAMEWNTEPAGVQYKTYNSDMKTLFLAVQKYAKNEMPNVKAWKKAYTGTGDNEAEDALI